MQKKTQQEKLLEHLAKNKNNRVNITSIVGLHIYRYGAVIHKLRKFLREEGGEYTIEHKALPNPEHDGMTYLYGLFERDYEEK